MSRRPLAFAIRVAGVTALFGALAQAQVTPYTVTSDVRIQMDDGVSLDSDEYVPNGCTSQDPCPVILVQTPYRKSGGAGVAEGNTIFPQHGYAMIVVDVRGTGSSEGLWDSFGANEQHDSAELVQWAAQRPFSNGVIGLSGASYGGINQFLTVEQEGTDAVKAIFPVIPMSDAYRDVTWSGGSTDAGFIPLWLGLVNALNIIPAQDAQQNPTIALNAESQHLYDVVKFAAPAVVDASLGNFEAALPAPLQTDPDQSFDGTFYRIRSPIEKISSVQVPTFIVGGTYDIFQRGEPILYNALDLPQSRKKLVIGPWYHVTAGNGLPAKDQNGATIPSVNDLQLAWFDHWLKGVPNDIEDFPTVETYVLGSGKWVSDERYPATGTEGERWYLSAASSGVQSVALDAGSLAATADVPGSRVVIPWIPLNGVCSRSTTQWTAGIPTLAVASEPCESDNRVTEALGVTFTTRPFSSDYVLSGPMNANLVISSTRTDTQLIATISDVAPDGSSNQITSGTLVASLRAVTTAGCGSVTLDCSVYRDDEIIEPWHPYTRASQVPLEPLTPTEMQIEIFPTTAVIKMGHSLRLTITTADVPHLAPTLSTTVSSAGGIDTLYIGPSYLYLGTTTPREGES